MTGDDEKPLKPPEGYEDSPYGGTPHGTSDTSIAAAEQLTEEEATRQREIIFNVLDAAGLDGLTGEGTYLARPASLQRVKEHSVSTRIRELVVQKRVIDSCLRRSNLTERLATVWVTVNHVPRFLLKKYLLNEELGTSVEHLTRSATSLGLLVRMEVIQHDEVPQLLAARRLLLPTLIRLKERPSPESLQAVVRRCTRKDGTIEPSIADLQKQAEALLHKLKKDLGGGSTAGWN